MPEQVSECIAGLLVFWLTSLTILTVLQAQVTRHHTMTHKQQQHLFPSGGFVSRCHCQTLLALLALADVLLNLLQHKICFECQASSPFDG
jgi:hypothetical protein